MIGVEMIDRIVLTAVFLFLDAELHSVLELDFSYVCVSTARTYSMYQPTPPPVLTVVEDSVSSMLLQKERRLLTRLEHLNSYVSFLPRFKELDRETQIVTDDKVLSELQLKYSRLNLEFERYFEQGITPDNYEQLIVECTQLLKSTQKKIEGAYLYSNIDREPNPNISILRSEQEEIGPLFSELIFYENFYKDLESAKNKIVIVSPYISTAKCSNIIERLEPIMARGVEVKIFTKPIREHRDQMALNAEQMISKAESLGISVIQSYKLHQKFAVIDQFICWEGSLNILSHNDTRESMRRLCGAVYADQIQANVDRTF